MAQLSKPIFQQGAPIDIGELDKLYTNTVLAYQQSAVLANATSTGQSQAFVSISECNSVTLTLDDTGAKSTTISFGNIFNFGRNPIVVASLAGENTKIVYTVSAQVTSANTANIYVFGGTAAKGKQVTVNWIATANKPITII